MFSRSSASGPAPPSRRSSVIPPRAPSATGAPIPPKTRAPTLFSAFTGATTAPKPAAPVSDVNSSVRPSVISPSGSAASSGPRHRATISEAAKKGPSTTSRLTNQPAVGGGPARAMRTVGSISSIREVDNGKVSELQEKVCELCLVSMRTQTTLQYSCRRHRIAYSRRLKQLLGSNSKYQNYKHPWIPHRQMLKPKVRLSKNFRRLDRPRRWSSLLSVPVCDSWKPNVRTTSTPLMLLRRK